MPWKDVRPMDERVRFIMRLLDGERMTDLCREYGVTRKTGYKFLERYNQFGMEGLNNQSRRPFHLARKTCDEIEKLIINLKGIYPTWGPKKLKAKLAILQPGIILPATSTFGEILDRHGLVKSRKKMRSEEKFYPTDLSTTSRPNEQWCVDFKGQFRLGNTNYCYPLTVTDHFSRYLLQCEALTSTKTSPVIAAFEQIFDEQGVPESIRSDNGIPFGSRSIGGLSELSAWWMSLGIRPERIRPGHPEENGRHERMHRTLKAETTRPAASNQLQQQEKFDEFKKTFNEERPHEALDMKTPNSVHEKSKRTLTEAQKEFKYPLHDATRKVFKNGRVRLLTQKDQPFFIGRALRGHTIGLRELDQGILLISLGQFDLGFINSVTRKFTSENPLTPQED
jgi:transposase InsO family protein